MTVCFVKRLAITRIMYPSPTISSRDHGPAVAGPRLVRHRAALRRTRRRGQGNAGRYARAPRPDRRVLPPCASGAGAVRRRHVPTVACYLLVLRALGRSAAADALDRVPGSEVAFTEQ